MKLTQQEIAQLAEDCVNNHLTKQSAQFFLQKININPDEIPDSDNLKTYYINVIQYLLQRDELENWLLELTAEKIVFAKEWLKKCIRLKEPHNVKKVVILNSVESFRPNYDKQLDEFLKKATEIRLCGWTLRNTIERHHNTLCEVKEKRGCILRVLLLNFEMAKILDDIIGYGNFKERVQHFHKNKGSVVSEDIKRTLDVLNFAYPCIHLCNILLPFGMTMIKCADGFCWLSVQIYPLHPDFPIPKRFSFELSDPHSDFWKNLEQQFDDAWEDKKISNPFTVEEIQSKKLHGEQNVVSIVLEKMKKQNSWLYCFYKFSIGRDIQDVARNFLLDDSKTREHLESFRKIFLRMLKEEFSYKETISMEAFEFKDIAYFSKDITEYFRQEES